MGWYGDARSSLAVASPASCAALAVIPDGLQPKPSGRGAAIRARSLITLGTSLDLTPEESADGE